MRTRSLALTVPSPVLESPRRLHTNAHPVRPYLSPPLGGPEGRRAAEVSICPTETDLNGNHLKAQTEERRLLTVNRGHLKLQQTPPGRSGHSQLTASGE